MLEKPQTQLGTAQSPVLNVDTPTQQVPPAEPPLAQEAETKPKQIFYDDREVYGI